jgi:hypothetical protein
MGKLVRDEIGCCGGALAGQDFEAQIEQTLADLGIAQRCIGFTVQAFDDGGRRACRGEQTVLRTLFIFGFEHRAQIPADDAAARALTGRGQRVLPGALLEQGREFGEVRGVHRCRGHDHQRN